MRHLIALLAISLLVAACQTTSTATKESDRELIDDMIKVTTTVCESKLKTEKDGQELIETLNMSPRDLCECTYRKFFGTMDDRELDRFIDDSVKYGGKVAEREPWKRRAVKAMVSCMSRTTAGLTTPSR